MPPYDGVPAAPFSPAASQDPAAYTTKISELSNGIAVASEEFPGPWCCLNVILGVGPRHEPDEMEGVAYFMEKLAFKSTARFDDLEILHQLQKLGGNFICTGNRETLMYQGTVFHTELEAAMEVLSEVVLRPQFTAAEVEEQRGILPWEQAEIIEREDVFLPELLHRAAYGPATLGRAHVGSDSKAAGVTSASLHAFHRAHIIPPKIAISGAGVEHEALLALSDKYFGEVAGVPGVGAQPKLEQAEYIGGVAMYPMEKSPTNNAKKIPLTQIGVGFEGVGWVNDDLYALAVMQLLLGGGLSFSVGGPGKGVFARLYQYVLNTHYWVHLAQAMNLSYEDSGLFFIQGAGPPDNVQYLSDLFLSEIARLVRFKVPDEELTRSKNQLKAHLLINLESLPIVAEDIGRQVLAFRKRLDADELCARIDAVTSDDLWRVTVNMVSNKPSLAAYGDITKLLPYEHLCEQVKKIEDMAGSLKHP